MAGVRETWTPGVPPTTPAFVLTIWSSRWVWALVSAGASDSPWRIASARHTARGGTLGTFPSGAFFQVSAAATSACTLPAACPTHAFSPVSDRAFPTAPASSYSGGVWSVVAETARSLSSLFCCPTGRMLHRRCTRRRIRPPFWPRRRFWVGYCAGLRLRRLFGCDPLCTSFAPRPSRPCRGT